MKTTCPHCSQSISIDPETLASLQRSSHFECPACAGAVAVPLAQESPQVAPLRIPDEEATSVSMPSADTVGPTLLATHHDLNRNLLILGSVALFVLGGLAAFIASRKDGGVHKTTQNIRNEIINNSYFQNLITTGVTTLKDLDAIADIRPFEDGFIGISKESLTWQQAEDVRMRTGAEILPVDESGGTPRDRLVKWLTETFKSRISPSAWIRERGEARVLVGTEILAATDSNGMRPSLFRWQAPLKRISPLKSATKYHPFVNQLGMQFVPVPGTGVLMCIHETRRQDYAAYAAEVSGVPDLWMKAEKNGIPAGHENLHPAVMISWEAAQAFCQWLSQKEGRTYRLPSDREWSYAVGIGSKEVWTKDATPKLLNGKVTNEFPWGGGFPPKSEDLAGNFADDAYGEKWPTNAFNKDYADGYATTAPVMSFKPNDLGIYDLGGNVWEWVDDLMDPTTDDKRALRGNSFTFWSKSWSHSSFRRAYPPKANYWDFGFRVVVELPAYQEPAHGPGSI